MPFIEVQFPPDIAYGSSGGPEFSTDVVELVSGHEQRNANWAQARARFNVAHGIKTQAQLDELIAFFRARKGKADAFRFKDWSDYKATAQLIGTGNGVTTAFQLVKNYASGGITTARVITKPVSGTVQVFLNGVLQASGFTINTTTGVVTFTAAPANGVAVTATYEFDVPVRFDTDRLAASLEQYGVHSWSDIPVIEIRV